MITRILTDVLPPGFLTGELDMDAIFEDGFDYPWIV